MLYTALATNRFNVLFSLTECSDAVSEWFLQNALLLNPDKTEAVIFGTRQRLSTIDGTHGITVAGSSVHFSDAVKLLGVTLDQTLSFDQHISNVVRSCTYHTRALRHIRPLITIDAAKMIASSIVGARLDYCNSLLFGTTACNLDRQHISACCASKAVLSAFN